MTRALLKPDIAREMGIVLLRPGRELMHLFTSGRVLVERQPGNRSLMTRRYCHFSPTSR